MDFKYVIALIYFISLCFYQGLSCKTKSSYADLESGTTFYSITEDGKFNKRIVMTHGLLSDSEQFDSWRCIFSHTGYQVLTYDLLGHGNTEWKLSGFFPQQRFVTQLNQLLKHIGWVDSSNKAEEKISFLGISMGGLIVINYALTHPEHVSSLISMCPPGIMTKYDFPDLYKLSNSPLVNAIKNIHSSKGMFKCGLYCASKLGFVKLGKQTKEEKKVTTDTFHKMFSTYVKSGGNGNLFDRHLDFEMLSKYENQFRIIFFWGMNDDVVPFSPALEFLVKHFRRTPIVVYPNIKHIPAYPMLSPALVALDFLESNFKVGVPLGQVKELKYFYDNEVNIVQGMNFTISNQEAVVKFDITNLTEDYLDFLDFNSS
ncbi:Alpha/beta hydrolase family protein [Cryptosporidium meleagridis]|uniref:Alpha/beta hydrolase family protein n=1 Tax=Cryptosporidium meleagridis TaxID=93969 RepID=A0A2P4Z4Z7_9CRYT|nr:Alpha/beta hydrolase family protein [Cryptosporidium meleagridis]